MQDILATWCPKDIKEEVSLFLLTQTCPNLRLCCEDGVKNTALPILLGVTPAVCVPDNVRQLGLQHRTVYSSFQEGCPLFLQSP